MSVNENARAPKPDIWDAAQELKNMFGADLVYDEPYDALRRWTGTHWHDTLTELSKITLMAIKAIRSVGVHISGKSTSKDTIYYAKMIMQRDFTQREHCVNFRNGTLSIERQMNADGKVSWTLGELSAHNKEDNLTYCLPYEYEPEGKHQAIDAFIEGVVPDPLARACFRAHVGLSILRDTSLHNALILFGPKRSGKSVLMALARLVAGFNAKEARDWCPAGVFDNSLEGKRIRFMRRSELVTCIDELPTNAMSDGNEEIFKQLSAHGGAGARGIGRDEERETSWLAKIFMTTNDAPKTKDVSGAIFARIIPVSVPVHRPENQRDLNLLNKLEGEVPAFAISCIREALATLNRGFYQMSVSQKNILDEWSLAGNGLKRFIRDYCVIEAGARVPQSDLYASYCRILIESGAKPLSSENLGRELLDMDLKVTRNKGRATSTVQNRSLNGTYFQGIRLKTSNDVEAEGFDEDLSNDFSPAILSDEEITIEVDKLISAQRFEKAKKLVMRMTDKTNRDQTLNLMRECGYLEDEFNGRYGQQRIFEFTAAA
ncbi:hypothetical protein SE17_02520 [Kouleothrix aurantiaca]|uniref:RFX-type winged-helix domain-containing protein n=1 Tax=Kouleothrix aurantiaca TaxID=186479 RepID=A0A0P9DXH7_9CHLR|nr:hypothetical protein SE17_02520 [Kouleothrix aurantiaca]